MQYMVDEPCHCRVIMSQLPMGMYISNFVSVMLVVLNAALLMLILSIF